MRLAALILALLVSVVAAELFVRSFIVLDERIEIGGAATLVPDEVVDAAFVSDPELMWKLRPNVSFAGNDFPLVGVVSNEQGLRRVGAVSADKGPRETRILFIGDSVTFGWGVAHGDTFVHLTEQALRSRHPQVDSVCINAGVPGYSLFQGERFLDSDGFGYQPDLVVVGFGANAGAVWGNRSDAQNLARLGAMQPRPALRWSHLARLYRLALAGAPDSSDEKRRPRLLPAEFRALLARVHRASQQHGAELLVMVEAGRSNLDGSFSPEDRSPYQWEGIRLGRSLQLTGGGGAALVDGAEVLQRLARRHEVSEIFFDNIHPTKIGHAALASAVVAIVDPWLRARAADTE